MKALILAAGFGTRLRPITNVIPKALCPFFGIKFLDLAHFRLREQLSNIAVNTHYHSDKVESHIQTSPQFDSIKISFEDEIRGTGGSLELLKEWIGKDDLIIYNADIISDINISSFIDSFKSSGASASMAMLPMALEGKTPVFCSKDHILSFGDKHQDSLEKLTFSGIHIVSNRFIQRIPNTVPWSIIDTYKEIISDGDKVHKFIHEGYWADLGTPTSVWEAHMKLLENNDPETLLESIGVSPLRREQKLPKLILDQNNLSAWSEDHSLENRLKNSFVDRSGKFNQQVDHSIIVNSPVNSPDQALNNRIMIEGIEARI